MSNTVVYFADVHFVSHASFTATITSVITHAHNRRGVHAGPSPAALCVRLGKRVLFFSARWALETTLSSWTALLPRPRISWVPCGDSLTIPICHANSSSARSSASSYKNGLTSLISVRLSCARIPLTPGRHDSPPPSHLDFIPFFSLPRHTVRPLATADPNEHYLDLGAAIVRADAILDIPHTDAQHRLYEQCKAGGYALAEFGSCYAEVDKSGDGLINFNEFIHWMIEMGVLKLDQIKPVEMVQ